MKNSTLILIVIQSIMNTIIGKYIYIFIYYVCVCLQRAPYISFFLRDVKLKQ